MPVVFAVQPEEPTRLVGVSPPDDRSPSEHPASIALSLADQQSGRHAMVAIEQWGGQALDVTEDAIRGAHRRPRRNGIYTDPASAAALAGYRQAVATGRIKWGNGGPAPHLIRVQVAGRHGRGFSSWGGANGDEELAGRLAPS